MTPGRPPVSVVVPFRGERHGAERLARSLARVELGADDEVVVVDNSDEACFAEGSGVRVVRATKERSSYFARNAGAAASAAHSSDRERPRSSAGTAFPGARGDSPRPVTCERPQSSANVAFPGARLDDGGWLVFIDSDCVPQTELLDAYFDPSPSDEVGALAGTVASDPSQTHFLARYAADRGFLDQQTGVHTAESAAATANLAVRREAFEEVGGFEEGIRSGGDVDLCRRLLAAGWKIERRPAAVVTHLHRESLPDLMGAIARYASGARWLNERYPGSAPQWPVVPGLIGAVKDIAANVARRRFEEAAFRGIDGLGLVAHAIGYRRSNAAR